MVGALKTSFHSEFLKTLGLYNCIFGEIFGILPVLTPHHQNRINNAPSGTTLKVQPFLDLEQLAIVSECSTKVYQNRYMFLQD